MPALTRRGLLAGTAAAAAQLAGGGEPAVASTSAPASDVRLAALWQDFVAALDILHAAERHRSVCESRYFDEGPDIPAALRRGGPLGRLLRRDWDWWDAADLRDLLKDRARRKHWRAARACGFKAAEAAQLAAMDALAAIADQILAIPAHTLAGLAVKARMVKAWGRPELSSDDPGHADPSDRLVAQVLEGVVAMVG
jgi:hypothetical protein